MSPQASRRYRIGFVLEQTLGHVTHSKNLMANVPSDPEVVPYWALVPWETHGLAARLPLYRGNWTVRAGMRARGLLRQLTRDARKGAGGGHSGTAGLDALFFHTQVPAILATDWLRRVPGVISLDATPFQYDELGEHYKHAVGPRLLEHCKWRLNRNCFRAARHLVAWSAWTKRGLVADYEVPAEKITVIPPGVNVGEWRRPVPRARPDGRVKILFVGADLERKGGRLLLEAFRRLRAEAGGTAAPDPELHLVTRTAVPAERGLFVYNDVSPNSDRLKRLYHACDIFCLPTLGDTHALVLSEAGAAGLPAVTTDVAGIPEIVRDGETGLLASRGDVQSLAAALRRLLHDEDLRRRLGVRAAEVVSREFDAGKNTARLLDLLKQVAREDAGVSARKKRESSFGR